MVTSDKDGWNRSSSANCLTPHRPRWRRPITLNAGGQPPAESSNQKVPELAGAVHSDWPPLIILIARVWHSCVYQLDKTTTLGDEAEQNLHVYGPTRSPGGVALTTSLRECDDPNEDH